MTYKLLIGQRAYSSWSLRGWLAFAAFGIPTTLARASLYSDGFKEQVRAFGGAGSVPVAVTPDGGVLTDSLAIAWHLSEAFPDRGLLPGDAVERAEAQSLIAEMHTGFVALRSACPMNLLAGWQGFTPSPAVLADIARLEDVWSRALGRSGGPFLYGDYSLADVVFAPVATRFATYGLPRSDSAARYIAAHLGHGPFRQWRAMGIAEGLRLTEQYEAQFATLTRGEFPAVPPLPARIAKSGPSGNATCPYSGDPVTHFLVIDGRIFGFCNAFCRDKTVADPEAWPAFMEIYHS